MKLFGWEISRTRKPPAEAAATTRSRGGSGPGTELGRPSWYTYPRAFGSIALERDLQVFDDLRRLFPVIDSAITKLLRLVGGVSVEGSARVVEDLSTWMRDVQVNQVSRGLETWVATQCDQMLMYGFAVGEIVATRARNEVFALTNLEARTILLRPGSTGLELRVFQRQLAPPRYVEITSPWLLFSMHRPRGDDPHGTSLLRTLPRVGEAMTLMQNAVQQDWERRGAPSYHVNWQPDPGFVDPDGTLAATFVNGVASAFATAMAARKKGDIQDVFTSGNVTVGDIGPKGQPLPFVETYRSQAEQMVAALGLPAWMLGLHWSTTERLSTVQAEMILADIEALRRELQPQLEYLLDLRQRLVGRRGRFKVVWKEVTLTDLVEGAQAEVWQQQSRSLRIENSRRMWALGWWTQLQAAQAVDDELVTVATEYPAPPEGPSSSGGLPTSNPTPVAGHVLGRNGHGHAG